MNLTVTRAALAEMKSQAARAHPNECCGILRGREGRIESAVPARNVHPGPQTHFEIDPQALIDAHRAARSGGPEVIGYYHSHPEGPAAPSATDRADAAHDGRVWAIVGKGGVTFWRDGEDGFVPLSYEVEDG
jgi:proteasome lid subunit RPN8/RPN11